MELDRCCPDCHQQFGTHGQCCLRAEPKKELGFVAYRPGRGTTRPHVFCASCGDAPRDYGDLCRACWKRENDRWADLARRIG